MHAASNLGPVATRVVVALVALVAVGGTWLGLSRQLQGIERSIAITVDSDTRSIEQLLKDKTLDALAFAKLLASDAEIAVLLEEQDRPALLARMEAGFEELRRDHDVAHLHFAVPPATSLLRVHAPDLYGDDLTPFRPMLVAAMESGKPLSGFERGRMGASARATVPVRSVKEPEASGPARVVGLVDFGFSLDEALVSGMLPDATVALLTLPSESVAEAVGRRDPPVLVSTLPPDIELVVDDEEAALALVDGDLTSLVPHDQERWRLSRRVLTDFLGAPNAVLIVASDISDARSAARLAQLTAALTTLLLVSAGAALVVLQRGNRRRNEQAAATMLRSRQLARALRQAETEPATLEVLHRAMEQIVATPGASRLLLADSSRAHLEVALDHGFGAADGELPTPTRCPAANSGEAQHFPDLRALDACAFLLTGTCSAGLDGALRCRPLSIRGTSVGVLQAQAARGTFDDHVEHQLDDLVRQAGDHLTQVRIQAETVQQAGTDPLTGLANRRHFDRTTAVRLREARPYSVLYADLDHFKRLNDTHGHDVGDRALRLFAGVLTTSVRPEDVVARFGGEEFVIHLNACDRAHAHEAAERIRAELVLALASGTVPRFTVSIGIADHLVSDDPFSGEGFDQVLRAADAALLRAKADGRDRIATAEPAVRVPRRDM